EKSSLAEQPAPLFIELQPVRLQDVPDLHAVSVEALLELQRFSKKLFATQRRFPALEGKTHLPLCLEHYLLYNMSQCRLRHNHVGRLFPFLSLITVKAVPALHAAQR